MKETLLKTINEYFKIFPDEEERLKILKNFVSQNSYSDVTDWNNFYGHIVGSAFIYSLKEDKFLALYHNDFKIFIYPGGHVDKTDLNILDAAKREVKEETGLEDYQVYNISNNPLLPIDIDIHNISYNEKLDLPEHLHFDFRYLFIIDHIVNVKTDPNEMRTYKWISINEFSTNAVSKRVIDKLNKYIETFKENSNLK